MGIEHETYSYESLMDEVRAHIIEHYGGVAEFLRSEKYKEEFGIGQKTKANVRIYLSNGANGGKVTKSFPMLKRLYKLVIGIELEAQTIVTRTQVITKLQSRALQ